jgi:hypothetical protein
MLEIKTDSELNTILAALRVFQAIQDDGGRLPAIMRENDVLNLREMSHFEDCDPLGSREIDTLCERLNLCGRE